MSKKIHSLDWQIGGRDTQLHTLNEEEVRLILELIKKQLFTLNNIAARKLGFLQK